MPVIYCIIPSKSPSMAQNDTRSGRLYAIIDKMTETYQAQRTAFPDIASGKDAAYENFPVGSWLLPAPLRPHIAKYYNFARTIDDIADTDKLPAEEKCRQLNLFADVIRGQVTDDPALAPAVQMLRSLEETGITPQHCLDLIDAFKQDAVKTRYGNWDELIGYCLRSASPVGRYLLDLHGEDRAHYPYSDALCNTLQIINHLQDCQDDFQTLDRVYIPEPWFTEFGSPVAELSGDHASPGMRAMIDRALDKTEELMISARELPGVLSNRRLAMESAVIVRIADKLIVQLRSRDPLQARVKLSKAQYISACTSGIVRTVFARRNRRRASH